MNATPKCFTPSKIFPGQNGAPFATRFLFRKLLHFRGTKNQMSAELAHQKADMHLYVALHRKVRIRLHPSKEPVCGIASKNLCRMLPCQENKSKQYGDTTQ